jgi:hypothetical protein
LPEADSSIFLFASDSLRIWMDSIDIVHDAYEIMYHKYTCIWFDPQVELILGSFQPLSGLKESLLMFLFHPEQKESFYYWALHYV